MRYLLPWQESQAKALFGDEMQSLTPELSKSKSGPAKKVHVITDLEDLDATEVEKLERIAQRRGCLPGAADTGQTLARLATCTGKYVAKCIGAGLTGCR